MSAEVFIVKYRGGIADGNFALAAGRLPPLVEVSFHGEESGPRQLYRFERAEPQEREVFAYNPASRQTERKKITEAHYQIFVPAGEVES